MECFCGIKDDLTFSDFYVLLVQTKFKKHVNNKSFAIAQCSEKTGTLGFCQVLCIFSFFVSCKVQTEHISVHDVNDGT